MAKYTIEDIEILRQKSGITYEEAVNLLEYHNGSLARALVDLEKNGRLINNGSAEEKGHGFKGLIQFLYGMRLIVKKGEVTVLNLSALFSIVVAISAPHILILGGIAALVLGYRFSAVRSSRDFSRASFDDLVKNAKSNVHNTVNSIAHQLAPEDGEEPAQPRAESAPSGTRPVNVPFADGGSVDVRDDGDGFHEANIR